MLNNKYIPKWKMELEQEKKKITKEIIKETEVEMLKLMKNNGIAKKLIKKIAKQRNIPINIVENILKNNNDK